MRVAGVILALTGLSVASAAMAGDHDYRHSRKYKQQADFDYARVVDVEPIVKEVRIETPRRECRESIQAVESRPDTGARTVLGGVIGGVIGSQFGSGRGRDAATVAGALIGSRVGYDSANGRYSRRVEERVVERCRVSYETEYEERIEGYRVTYLYNGREYTTRLPYDPGDRIKVRVAVAPAE
jgi:uncharacterized protein YcfJ